MKKINLFLWGIVSTCITFFYRTEIYGADYRYTITDMSSVTTCAGYDEDVDNVETTLQNNIKSKRLCLKDFIFMGCSRTNDNGTTDEHYELSEYGLDALASYCLGNNGAICRDDRACPAPGTRQDSDKDTFIYLDTEITVCSTRYIVILADGNLTHRTSYDTNKDPIHYKQTIKLLQPRDRFAFGHVNSLSNTCAINTEDSIEDDTGWYSYTEKCYYTE